MQIFIYFPLSRRVMKILMWIVGVLLVFSSVEAATIHGEVFAWDTLEEVNALVEITSEPKQQDVVRAGEEYSFIVEPGTYIISAKTSDGVYSYKDQLVIEKEGEYVLDLVLFDALLDDEFPDLGDDEITLEDESNSTTIFLIIAGILLLGGILLFILRKKDNPTKIQKIEEEILHTDEDLEKVLRFIKESDGRITQKEIRKKMLPLSEAKVSLLLTELEAKGVIKRIKKGRSNVILLIK